jgi:uncharacterized LabA/DUF88 family protein
MPTAILVDGGFFLRRYQNLRGPGTPQEVAQQLRWMCGQHLKQGKNESDSRSLYRIFFYDCPPLTKKAHHPLTGKPIDFAKTPIALWRRAFHDELKRQRKLALRLGYLNEKVGHWTVKRSQMKRLFRKEITLDDLDESDVSYDVKQKGVDMRIGLDIASMCFKRQVNQIILVAGDSDFVPAAKLARREGIDFVLDPMWARIRDDLFEHIDGLRSVFPRPKSEKEPINDANPTD